jgi:hypothetical protein
MGRVQTVLFRDFVQFWEPAVRILTVLCANRRLKTRLISYCNVQAYRK